MMSPSTHTEVGAWMSEQNQGCSITSELNVPMGTMLLASPDPGKFKPSSIFASFSMI